MVKALFGLIIMDETNFKHLKEITMRKILLATTMILPAGFALAGGGGEELPFVYSPVAEVVPAPAVLCDDPRVNDTPRVHEMWFPETDWTYSEWQGNGWNPLNDGWTVDYVDVVLSEPDTTCTQIWLDANRPTRTEEAR